MISLIILDPIKFIVQFLFDLPVIDIYASLKEERLGFLYVNNGGEPLASHYVLVGRYALSHLS